MKNSKLIFLENIIPLEHCVLLEKRSLEFLKQFPNDTEAFKYFHTHNRVDIGYAYEKFKIFDSLDEYNKFFDGLTKKMESIFDEKLKFSHNFYRIYYNNSRLMPHIDKPGLDITLTVNIGGLQDWKIFFAEHTLPDDFIKMYSQQKFDEYVDLMQHTKKYRSFETPRGSGVVCYARKTPHWRETLICNEHEYMAQIFFHWTIVN